MGRSAMVTARERGEREGLAGRRRPAQGLARIVLLAAEGLASKAIAAEVGADRDTVGKGHIHLTPTSASWLNQVERVH